MLFETKTTVIITKVCIYSVIHTKTKKQRVGNVKKEIFFQCKYRYKIELSENRPSFIT